MFVHAAASHALVAFIEEMDEPTCVVRTARQICVNKGVVAMDRGSVIIRVPT